MPSYDNKGLAIVGVMMLCIFTAIWLAIAATRIDQIPGEPVMKGMVTFFTMVLALAISMLIFVIRLERRGRANLR